MDNGSPNNSENVKLDTGLRWFWGAALGLTGSALIQIGMSGATWSLAGVIFTLIGIGIVIKAIFMLKEIAKILIYIALGIIAIALVISIVSNIELTTPLAIIFGAIIIAIAINNR